MKIILIAAMASNRIIGKDNTLPWHIPEELKLFKKETIGHPMIMGRKTFESFPAPLPGRRHIVMSRSDTYSPKGGEKATSLTQALEMVDQCQKVYIIGGAEIFRQAFTVATAIKLTLLDRKVDGDVRFPEFAEAEFTEISRERHTEGSEPFTVIRYKRAREKSSQTRG